MRWTIIATGKPAIGWARQGIDDYLSRLQKTGSVECVFVINHKGRNVHQNGDNSQKFTQIHRLLQFLN